MNKRLLCSFGAVILLFLLSLPFLLSLQPTGEQDALPVIATTHSAADTTSLTQTTALTTCSESQTTSTVTTTQCTTEPTTPPLTEWITTVPTTEPTTEPATTETTTTTEATTTTTYPLPDLSAYHDSDHPLVRVALEEYAKSPGDAGEKYWQWAVYPEKVDWCAIFISYCAEQVGYLQDGTIKLSVFADAHDFGVSYRSANDYIPSEGDIIIYDWENKRKYSDAPDAAEHGDHVGIVVDVDSETGVITTVEGNGALPNPDEPPVIIDRLIARTVTIDYPFIKGYGVY